MTAFESHVFVLSCLQYTHMNAEYALLLVYKCEYIIEHDESCSIAVQVVAESSLLMTPYYRPADMVLSNLQNTRVNRPF